MEQPSMIKNLLGWMSEKSSSVLTRQQIIEALDSDLQAGLLATESNSFIWDFITPFLEITRDEPEHLVKVLKATLNVIYLMCDPDSQYMRSWKYRDAKDKPEIPYYPNMGIIRADWRKRFNEWVELAKCYVEKDGRYFLSKNIDFSSFEQCFLSSVPEDGTVFLPNVKMFTQLQILARKHIVFEKPLIQEHPYNRELRVLPSLR